ncbi:MAG: hypothetical protein P8L37_06910 [Phycisphaerales bacterium]|nr:hypothetical protein [Phycisphaerales bacterium]
MAHDSPFRFISPGSEQVAGAFRRINRQPNWVLRTAVLVFLLLVGLPILALLLIAAVVATVVFAILAGWNSLLNLLRGSKKQERRRKNVRVIDRN